jgi:hypothetical protein
MTARRRSKRAFITSLPPQNCHPQRSGTLTLKMKSMFNKSYLVDKQWLADSRIIL